MRLEVEFVERRSPSIIDALKAVGLIVIVIVVAVATALPLGAALSAVAVGAVIGIKRL